MGARKCPLHPTPSPRICHLEDLRRGHEQLSRRTRARLVRGAEEGERDVNETKRPPVRTVLCLAVTEQRGWLMSFFNLYLHLCTAVLYLGRFSHCLTGTFLETGAPCRAPGAGAGSACAPVYPPIAMRVVFSFRRCKRVPGTRQPCRGPRPAARHAFPSFERPERSPELPAGSPRSRASL